MTARPLGCHVAGSDAFLLSAFLRRSDVDEFIRRSEVANPRAQTALRSLRQLVDTIHAAAGAYVASAAEGPPGPALQGSGPTLSTTEAALMLDVTPRRVRQLLSAGALDGRMVGRTWRVECASVELRKEEAA